MKVVINRCFGGFGLSTKAVMRYAELSSMVLYPVVDKKPLDFHNPTFEPLTDSNKDDAFVIHYLTAPLTDDGKMVEDTYFSERDIKRDDPLLVQLVEEMGDSSSGDFSKLEIVEIPNDVEWVIEEYDGNEHIAEAHRTW